MQVLVDPSPLTVCRFQGQGSDNITKRGAGQVHDLVFDAVDIVLREFNTVFIRLDLEINLRINLRIQVIIGNDLLGFGVDHFFSDIHLVHFLNDRNDPVKARE